MKRSPIKTDPAKVRAWQNKHKGSLKADPEVTREFVRRGREKGARALREAAQEAARAPTRPDAPVKARKPAKGRKAAPVDWPRFASQVAKLPCPVPGCRRRPYELPHHVVYQQEIRRLGGDVSDPRNALSPCGPHHDAHHAQGDGKLPLSVLRDENFAYAADLLGPAAYAYLRRRYGGDDPRLDELAKIPARSRGGQLHEGDQ